MEIREDNNTIKLKKDVVKNIAIVFLAIMLILTFFSNSIMNKSLPEVATQYVQSGTITEKIRGTGIVEADDPYSVIVQETRKIESVAVKVGDEVEKDQPLFYLEDSDSTELEEAERALEDLILKYTAGALTGEMSDGAYKNATAGRVLGMNTYEAQIEAAKNRVKAAEELIASLERQKTILDGTSDAGTEANLNQTKADLEKAQLELTKATEKYTELKAVVDAGSADSASAKAEYDLAKTNKENSEAEYSRRLSELVICIKNDTNSADVIAFKESHKDLLITDSADIANCIVSDAGELANNLLNEWVNITAVSAQENGETARKERILAAQKNVNDASAKCTDAQTDLNAKKIALDQASAKASEYSKAQSELSAAESSMKSAQNKVDELQMAITSLTNAMASNAAGNAQLASDLTLKLADANLELTKAKEAQSQLLTDISKTLDLTNQNSIIRDQQEKVAKLREKATGAVITSPVTGTILTVTKTAGESTTAAEALATIQVTGKPMTMNFAVTAEQAKKVKIGDQATLQNAWYYSDNTKITLTKIANDPNNPGRSKLLMFNVEGEVSNGESLSVSLGQRSREFQLVVPNSAVREDNRGKFIYIIEEKGTPFGNRYKAKRIDVEVVASDDNNTAIEANMDAWVYVITTSNKPIESGQQVRLSDR